VILFRHSLGKHLRSRRLASGRTLRDLSGAAQVSLGYLSEIERGHKEASSELLGAICAALHVDLSDVLLCVSADVSAAERSRVAVVRAA